MNPELSHERCSELLADHVDGRLDPTTAQAVSDHLATCVDCLAEAEAVRALHAAPAAAMTEEERRELRAGVLASLDYGDDEAEVVDLRKRSVPETVRSSTPSPFGARVAQVLGAAALVVLLGGLLYLGGEIVGGGDGSESGAPALTEQDRSGNGAVEGGGDAGQGRAGGGAGGAGGEVADAEESAPDTAAKAGDAETGTAETAVSEEGEGNLDSLGREDQKDDRENERNSAGFAAPATAARSVQGFGLTVGISAVA